MERFNEILDCQSAKEAMNMGIGEPLSTQRIKVYYFSGTGNTQLVAGKIVETFERRGFTAALFSMEDAGPIVIDDDEIIGIGFPVAVFTTFPIVFRFLERIAPAQGNGAFVFDTLAGTSMGGIIGRMKRILRGKGFTPLGCREFRMPPNIFFHYPEPKCRERISKSLALAERFVDELIAGKGRWKEIPLLSYLLPHLSGSIYNLTQSRWHQRNLKMKLDRAKCNSCGICAEKCPLNNIEIGDTAVIGDRCQYCFRCAGICPRGAIHGVASPRTLHYLARGAKF
jgi:ferredoxin/flavodoxin